jgi:hypothetical protein
VAPNLVCGTIVAKSHLSFARVLARSFHRHHPDIPFYVLLADEVDGYFVPAREPFNVLRLPDLGIPDLDRFRFRYSQQPLSYAATPYLLAYLLRRGFSRAVFLKQESLVLGDFGSLFEILGKAPIVLTPHLVTPIDGPDRIARELNILQSGTFNVGMLGIADAPVTGRFLAWWQDRVRTHCRHAVADGMHYEQRWLDLAPAFFEGVHILRDPTYNVGHWNLPERAVSVHGDDVLVDGRPCRLFRFSGYSPDEPQLMTRYSRRLTSENVGPARAVFDRFRSALEDEGYHETKSWPYAYGAFDNGVSVPDIARTLYLELRDAVEIFGNPLHTSAPGSYFSWLNESVESPTDRARTVTRLWQAVYRARPDLQSAFPDLLGADRDAFLNWTIQSGAREHGVPGPFLPVALPDRG